MNAEEPHCQLWQEWSDLAHMEPNTAGAYALNYVIYVLFAVVFAGLAGLYVTTLAPYAAGSGIPEVGNVWSETVLMPSKDLGNDNGVIPSLRSLPGIHVL